MSYRGDEQRRDIPKEISVGVGAMNDTEDLALDDVQDFFPKLSIYASEALAIEPSGRWGKPELEQLLGALEGGDVGIGRHGARAALAATNRACLW